MSWPPRPAEEGKTVVEEGRERHASGESFVVESERAACHPVRTNEALVFATARSNEGAVSSDGKAATIHAMSEVLAEETLFDGAGGRVWLAARANCCGRSGPSVATARRPARQQVCREHQRWGHPHK